MHRILIGLLWWIAFWASASGFAQEIPEQLRERIGASRYFLGKEDELLIPVNILGYVNKPGQYMVPNETDLISLVAFAGGFREDAKLNKLKILRGIAKNGQPNSLQVDLKKYFNSGDRRLIPRLLPDDTIIVSGSRAVTMKNTLDFVARVAIVFQIYFYLQVAQRN